MSALGLLGVVLITLKLLEITIVTTWSWWLVLLPWYLGIAIFAALALFALAVGGTGALLSMIGGRKSYIFRR